MEAALVVLSSFWVIAPIAIGIGIALAFTASAIAVRIRGRLLRRRSGGVGRRRAPRSGPTMRDRWGYARVLPDDDIVGRRLRFRGHRGGFRHRARVVGAREGICELVRCGSTFRRSVQDLRWA